MLDEESVIHIYQNEKQTEVFFFESGAFVAWGSTLEAEKYILDMIKIYQLDSLEGEEIISEEIDCIYINGNETRVSNEEQDTLILLGRNASSHDITMSKLALSSSMARSVALTVAEQEMDKCLSEIEQVPKNLAMTGKSVSSPKEVLKSIGKLLLIRGDVNLHSDILDSPEFAWNDKNLADLFNKLQLELEIEDRVNLLNKRLDHAGEVTNLINNLHTASHASHLETIIIILIVIEVFFNFKNDPDISFMKYFRDNEEEKLENTSLMKK